MIDTLAISGYRSLRDIVLPIDHLTVITGANGTGKSSVYRALRLLAGVADDRAIAAIAREGGFDSLRWAGPEVISRAMRRGDVPIQGTVRKDPVALKLGYREGGISYSAELGLPPPDMRTLFSRDPEIKVEAIWVGEKPTPSKLLARRNGPSLQVKCDGDKQLSQAHTAMRGYESMLRSIAASDASPSIRELRSRIQDWRFYDHFRTDAGAPVRQPQIGTRTNVLAADGRDLAAAIQTIFEVGDGDALMRAVDHAFAGARLEVTDENGLFQLWMRQPGMLRPLSLAELSDGTLRFLLLAAALLSPRPPPLIVLNEPESSLHGDLISALAFLIAEASDRSQIVVVSHNRALVSQLLNAEGGLVELYKDMGETFCDAAETPHWTWPKR